MKTNSLWIKTRRGCGCLVLFSVILMTPSGLAKVKKKSVEIPRRINLIKAHEPRREQLVLWKFEDEKISDEDSSIKAIKSAGVKLIAKGRFGRALSFAGGKSLLKSSPIKGLDDLKALSIDFWVKVTEYPGNKACLFEAESTHENLVRLWVLPGGKLELENQQLPKVQSTKVVPLGQWFHLAIVYQERFMPNGYEVEDTGLAVKINGDDHLVSYQGTTIFRFPTSSPKVMRFALGNRFEGDRGLRCDVDELHISRKHEKYYQLKEQAFLKPKAKGLVTGASTSYRKGHRFVAHLPLDHLNSKVTKYLPSQNVKKNTLNIDEEEDEMDVLDELDENLGADEKRKDNVSLVDGVRGKALRVKQGKLRLPFKKDMKIENATLDFWFKPEDYDNLNRAFNTLEKYRYVDSKYALMTLYGKSKSGGEGVPLLRFDFRRAWAMTTPFPVKIHPHKWVHVALVWSSDSPHYQPMIYVDGVRLGYDLRSQTAWCAKPGVWKQHRLHEVELGNRGETHFDEIRITDYAMSMIEVQNRRAEYTGDPLSEIQPVSCKFKYRLSVGELDIDLKILDGSKRRAHKAVITWMGGGKELTFASGAFEKGNAKILKAQVGRLDAGKYQLSGKLLDKQGRPLENFKASFERLETPWLDNRIGLVDTPPKPFTNMRVNGSVVSSVLRDHEVGDNGFFRSLRVKGEEILAEPMRLELKSRGGLLSLNHAKRITSKKSVAVEWESNAESQGLWVKTKVRQEYDGMAKFRLRYGVTKGTVPLERFTLKMILKKKYGELLHALPISGNFLTYECAKYLPKGKGIVWDSLSYSKVRGVDKRPLGNFPGMVWLGGHVRGLCWFADNDQGWFPEDDKPAVTIERVGDRVVMSLHFVSSPQRIEGEREITFALLATPSKPLPQDHRQWNRGNTPAIGPIGGRLISNDSFAPWEMPCREGAFDFWPTDMDWNLAKRAAKRQRKSAHPKYPKGSALMLYQVRQNVPIPPEGKYFSWEWSNSYPKSKVDMLVWYMDKWISGGIMDGIYFDELAPIASKNTRTGSAYRLPDGRVQPGNNQFAYREYFKRLHAIFAKNNLPSIVSMHMTSTMSMSYHTFADIIYDGEAIGRFASDKFTFIDAWPIDRMLTLNNSERTGLVTSFMFKGNYASRGRSTEHWQHMIWRAYRSAAAMRMLFDTNEYGRYEMEGLGNKWSEFFGPETEFIPFWKEKGLVKVHPLLSLPVSETKDLPFKTYWRAEALDEISREPLKVSVYKQKNRALIVVANFLRKTVKCKLSLDYRALGIPESKRSQVKVSSLYHLWSRPAGLDIQASKHQRIDASLQIENFTEDKVDLELDEKKSTDDYLLAKANHWELDVRAHNFRALELEW